MSVNTNVRYKAFTQYDGFRTGPVDLGQHDGRDDIVYIDNGDYYTVIWINGSDSGFLRTVSK